MPHRGRHRSLVAIKIAASLGLLALLFSKIDAGMLWAGARRASVVWLAVALLLHIVNVLASVWRWQLLLGAQGAALSLRRLTGTYLVAIFFNNFVPSNIAGDLVRIGDTAGALRSATRATLVVVADRVLVIVGVILVAAIGATILGRAGSHHAPPIWPIWLWAAFVVAFIAFAAPVLSPGATKSVLRVLTVLRLEWVAGQIDSVTGALERFRGQLPIVAIGFGNAVAGVAITVLFYAAVASALHIPVSTWDLAVIVPVSALVQIAPISINGLGLREATFSIYFSRIGLPIESALLVSLIGVGVSMFFSLTGAVIYVADRRHFTGRLADP